MFIVYTEIVGEETERWFYGRYNTLDRANEVALTLGNDYPIYHCVCTEEDAQKLGVKNL